MQSPGAQEFVFVGGKIRFVFLCDVEVVGGTKYAHGLDSLSVCFPK